MLKVKMEDFIIILMHKADSTNIWISQLLDAVKYFLKETNVMVTDEFDASLEAVLGAVLNNPNIFKTDDSMHEISLVEPDKLSVYVKGNPIDSMFRSLVSKYLEKYSDPMYVCGNDMALGQANEAYISRDSEYIDWLWDSLDENNNCVISTTRTKFKNLKDIVNTSMLQDLFVMLSRYYNKNMIRSYETEVKKTFTFKYRKDQEERIIGVYQKTRGDTKIYGTMFMPMESDAPYFPDIVFGVPAIDLQEKKNVLNQCSRIFTRAINLGISYDFIKDALDDIYGRNDQDE